MFWIKNLITITLAVSALMLFGNFANIVAGDVQQIERGLGSAFSVGTYIK